jgi:hypothetical protein
MKKLALCCLLFLALLNDSASQEKKAGFLPNTAVSLQYAGSTGFLTIGYLRSTARDRGQFGLQYGYTPAVFGGDLHSLSFKFLYNPIKLKLKDRVVFEPVQIGGFISQNFGKALEPQWGPQYSHKYYWWNASLRYHPFISTSVGIRTPSWRRIERVSAYFEVNTNDLYIASYFPKGNNHVMPLSGILFFGTGVKVYLKKY